jgi:hypothetical protein
MTDTTRPSALNDPPPTGPPAPPAAPRRRRRWPWVVLAIVVVFSFLGSLGDDPAPAEPAVDPAPAEPAVEAPEPAPEIDPDPLGDVEVPEPEPEPEPLYADNIKPKDFTLTAKIMERQRFGTAGDIVRFRVEIEYHRAVDLDPDITYELTYEITGGDDGPEVNTVEIRGDQYEVVERSLGTPADVEPDIKVLDVAERGF